MPENDGRRHDNSITELKERESQERGNGDADRKERKRKGEGEMKRGLQRGENVVVWGGVRAEDEENRREA